MHSTAKGKRRAGAGEAGSRRRGDSRARPASRPAAPPAPRAPPRSSALTCAARRRCPQQQQQHQQQRRGQQRGARAERATRFPAGVDIHAGWARVGARRDARGAGSARAADSAGPARPHEVMGSRRWPVLFVAAALRDGSAGALAHRQEGSTLARGAAGTPLGPLALASSNSSNSCLPPLAAAAPRPAPRGRSAQVRSCNRRDEECGPRLGRRALFSQVPPSLSPGRHPRRLSIPNACSKSEPGAGLGQAGPRLPLGAGGEGVGTVGESLRGRGWPGAGADVGRARRP